MRPLRWMGLLVLMLLMFSACPLWAADPREIINNIEKNDHQSVLTGKIDSLTITRGNAEFRLGPGNLTLFDFGSGRIAALAFEGKGQFRYLPPNEVERYQLHRFMDKDTLDETFNNLALFYTVELDGLPDTSGFTRTLVGKNAWKLLSDACSEEYDHMNLNMTNGIIGDLLAQGPGTYFNAFFEMEQKGQFVFLENPFNDDLYSMYHLVRQSASPASDLISGYSPDNDLPSQRGVATIDITHYNVASVIESNGKMLVTCRIHFTPLRWGRRYIYLHWYYDNKMISALSSAGDSLQIVHKDLRAGVFSTKYDESGFGLIFNKPLEAAVKDSIDITYECKSLENSFGMFYLRGQTVWYPQNIIRDVATFDMSFDSPKPFQVVGCGNLYDSQFENGRYKTRWRLENPANYVSFNIGDFESREFLVDSLAPVKVYLSRTYPHDEMALYLAYYGELSTADMIGSVGADVTNSLAFYSSLFGPCLFDTIRTVELFANMGQGSAGLIHLSNSTFQSDDIGGYDESFRAHEVAHQWWGHVVDNESYRDVWITEGLAEYCGYWFYQMSSQDKEASDNILGFWKSLVMSGYKFSDGYKAGPVVAGYRLSSSKSDDYQIVAYEKGAYIFHMIRYLMHDYKNASDDAFAQFLKDLAVKYKGKVITTEKLRALLEEHVDGDMGWFFNQWVYGTEIPEYDFKATWNETPENKYKVACHVVQKNVPSDFQMMVPLTVLFEDGKYVHLKIWVDQPEMDVDLPLLPYKPKKVIFNTYGAVLAKVNYK